MRKYLFFISLGIITFLLATCNNSDKHHNSVAEEISGKDIFSQYCVLCHGADGKRGFNNAKDLTKSTKTLNERIMIISHGKNLMTPFSGVLSTAEIKAVAQYTMQFNKNIKLHEE